MLRSFCSDGCGTSLLRAAFLLVCLQSATAHAQSEAATELDSVVVTATRSEQRLADTLPHTTVITRADIDRQQAHDVLELLSQQAGVEMARSGGFGSQASLFLRGTNSSQTLVLVDGIRLNTAVGGTATIGGINLDSVERIEIVRGNLSSLYGSEAIGGVIQIFTRGGGAPGASASVEAGAGHSRIGTVAANTKFGTTEFALAGGFREAKPFSAIDAGRVDVVAPFMLGANPDLDENRNRTGSLRVRQPLGERAEIAASAWTTLNDTDFDSTSDGPDATHHEHSQQAAWQVAGRVALTDWWTTRLQAGQARDTSIDTSSNPFSFSSGEFQARNRQLDWINTFAVLPAAELQLGLEQLDQRGASSSYDPNFAGALVSFDRRARAVWSGITAHDGAQQLQLNLRNDDYSDVGSATTGLAAYGYEIAPGWKLNAQYSTAFRAPSFNDLYFPGFGNPQLKPERARTVEAGLAYAAGTTRVRLAAYRTRTDNLIAFDTVTSEPQNIARAKIDGAELSASTMLADWRIDLSLDASRPTDESTDQRLLRRAPYRATLVVDRSFGPVELGGSVSHVAARYDIDINPDPVTGSFDRISLASYTLLRVTFAYRIDPRLRITARVENVTNAHYELVSGYNTQRRGAFVGLEGRI